MPSGIMSTLLKAVGTTSDAHVSPDTIQGLASFGSLGFVLGFTQPTDLNSGLNVNGFSSASLTQQAATSGDQIPLTTPNVTYNATQFNGWVVMSAAATGCTFNNCYFPGHPTTNTGLIKGTVDTSAVPDAGRPTFNYSKFQPNVPRYYLNAVKGGGIFYRCTTLWGVDHFNSNNQITIQGCYGASHAFFDGSTGTEHASDSRLPGWTHNDYLEQFSNTAIVDGCSMQMYFSATQGTPSTAYTARASTGNGTGYALVYPNRNYGNGVTMAPINGVVNIKVTRSWIAGGEVCFQGPAQGSGFDSGNTGEISFNRITGDQQPYSAASNVHQQFRYTVGMFGTAIVGLETTQTNYFDFNSGTPVADQGIAVPGPFTTSTQPSWQITYSSGSTPTWTLGVDEPTRATSGVQVHSTTKTPHTGDLSVSAGGTYSNLDITGFVTLTGSAADITLIDCIVRGRTFTTGSPPHPALVNSRSSTGGKINMQYCDIVPDQIDVNLTNIEGEALGQLYRCYIANGSDFVDYWNGVGNPNMQGCFLDGYTFWDNDSKHTSDSTHPGWSHNDGLQNSGSDGGLIIGNSIRMYAAVGLAAVNTLTSGGYPSRNYGGQITLTPSSGTITNITISQNWFYGGECHIQLSYQTASGALPFQTGNSFTSIDNNRHAMDVHGYGPYAPGYSKQFIRYGGNMGPSTATVTNNIFNDDSTVPTSLQGTLIPGPNDIGSGTSRQRQWTYNSPNQT